MLSALMVLGVSQARVHWITHADLICPGNALGLPCVCVCLFYFFDTHLWVAGMKVGFWVLLCCTHTIKTLEVFEFHVKIVVSYPSHVHF